MHLSTKKLLKANSDLIYNPNEHVLFVGDIISRVDFKQKGLF